MHVSLLSPAHVETMDAWLNAKKSDGKDTQDDDDQVKELAALILFEALRFHCSLDSNMSECCSCDPLPFYPQDGSAPEGDTLEQMIQSKRRREQESEEMRCRGVYATLLFRLTPHNFKTL